MLSGKQVGILCHITCLPNPNLGENGAIRFLEFLKRLGVSVWQVLPIHPPDEYGSPYASSSAFAGWVDLLEDSSKEVAKTEIENYCKQQGEWIQEYAQFRVLKERYNGAPWTEWPPESRTRESLNFSEIELQKIQKIYKEQYFFDYSWSKMKKIAGIKGIQMYGDIPFFVSHDSADVWACPERFHLNEKGLPTHVSGVPPDYFSETGQRWGTPLYNWENHKEEGFRWWKSRMKRMFQLFDIVRIDHFRAIDSAWSIPAHHLTAENGFWVDGPGDEFLSQIISSTKGDIIAEDLGIIPESVTKLRKRHDLPGMVILQFSNNDDNNPHNPENHTPDTVVYTGTHDNDTTLGWGIKPVEDTVIEALNSVSKLAIIPIQDILKLGSEARMNTPGTKEGNWSWQCKWDDLNETNIDWFRIAINDSGRLN
tara:strand:+ start:512 stop:1783 length:1272 start_codon:yes stop_codon:yes gene_type:complete